MSAREWSPTKEPVTVGGWYEHEDGTWTRFAWRDGLLRCVDTAANVFEIPPREPQPEPERMYVDASAYPDGK